MSRVLLDSNAIIYLANGMADRRLIAKKDICHASVSRIETLGFHNISMGEMVRIQELLTISDEISLDSGVIERAITLRQTYRLGLGDALVAASALQYGITLWTANVKDFININALQVYNPLTKESYGD